MIKLFCAIVGEAGSAFEVDIDDAESVSALKDAIKEKRRNKLNDVDATDLHLFLAKRKQNNEAKEEGEEENGEEKWLTQDEAQKSVRDTSGYTLLRVSGAELRDVGLASDQLGDVSRKDKAAGLGHVHVLVLVPRQTFTGKRTRERELFADERILKKRKVDGDDIRYFTMDKFPLMAHQVIKYKRILERDAYRVIFEELMGRVKKYLEIPSQANLVVTGNPGTGKSRFYLYCIFQLLLRHEKEVLELPPAFDLVLNFDDDFQLYDAETKEFIELNANEVRALRRQDRVLRLIEGKSSHLTGWCGVSILFASPGLAGMNDFTKVDSYRYIMPVWSFAELQNYNSLLGDELKLAEDVLVSRYNKFGGIPRFVFTHSEIGEEVQLRQAIQSFDASRIISYVQHDHAVRDNNYSHRVIAMIPSRDDYFEECYLDFLSNHIAEEIVFKLSDESVQEMSHFAIAQAVDDSGYTAVLRGKVYEMLCHRWFSIKLPKQPEPFMLKMRLLSSQPSHTFPNITFEKMKTERFSALKNIETLEQNIYYRPTSKTFGALDAFILIGNDCFGLQMTINQKHGIKHGPLKTNDANEERYRPPEAGGLANVNQYVAAFDVFKENLITSNKSDESSRVVTDGNGNGGGNGGGNGNGRGGNGGQGNDGGGDGRHDQVAAVPMGGGGGAPGGQVAAVPVGGGLGALGGQAAAVPRDEGWRDQLQPGQLIDALDTRDIWYESRVLSVSSALLKVHYRGWPSKWDDWIDRTSPRIAPLYSQTRNWRGLNVGDPVMVGRQVTTKICPEWRNAKVTACKNDGCLWVQVDSEEQWIDAQDEMLCPLGMHRASN